MRLCVLLRSAKLTAIGNNTLTIRTFLFSPPLSDPQDLDAPLCLAAQRKINGYGQQYADN